jgi:predicted hydrocarbon binding protein
MPFKLPQFLNNLNDLAGKDLREKLMQNRVTFDTLTTGTQKSMWIGKLVNDLVVEIGVDNAKNVMEACGQQCLGHSLLEKARLIQRDSQDIDEMLGKLNQAHIGGGKLRREGEVIYASYDKCYCGSVSKTRTPISTIYCQCSCGWYKKLFETILDKPVKVILLDSIIHGADSCQFIIQI